MAETVINAKNRDVAVKAKYLRQESRIPATVYGLGKDPASIDVDYADFERKFRTASYSTIIDLDVDGSVEKVLIKEIQYHPVMDTMDHVDFVRVDMNKEIHTAIPLSFVGNAPAVKSDGAMIATARDTVEVKCLPGSLVHDIEVSLESLALSGDSIHVKDIVVPEGMEILEDPDTVVVQAMATRGKAEEEASEEMASPDDVEVTSEKKEEESAE